MPVVHDHFAQLQARYPGAGMRELPDGSAVITVPNVRLPPGWNRQSVGVTFLVPVGYPMAKPDSFWTDPDLQLAPQGQPKSTGLQTPPFTNEPRLWFSWHADRWNPNQDNLLSFLGLVQERLRRAE